MMYPSKKDNFKFFKIFKKVKGRLFQAVKDYNLIEKEGDSILIGVSGGKDSYVLAYLLGSINGKSPYKFRLKALHISPEFIVNRDEIIDDFKQKMESWGIEYEVIKKDYSSTLQKGFDINCYWCSTNRRKELMEYAATNGFKKIALGHHINDIVNTYLMNIIYAGKLASMKIKMDYKKYNFSLIRPLGLVREDDIVKFVKEGEIYVPPTKKCRYLNENSSRELIDNFLKKLDKDVPHVFENILASETNINSEYLNL